MSGSSNRTPWARYAWCCHLTPNPEEVKVPLWPSLEGVMACLVIICFWIRSANLLCVSGHNQFKNTTRPNTQISRSSYDVWLKGQFPRWSEVMEGRQTLLQDRSRNRTLLPFISFWRISREKRLSLLWRSSNRFPWNVPPSRDLQWLLLYIQCSASQKCLRNAKCSMMPAFKEVYSVKSVEH